MMSWMYEYLGLGRVCVSFGCRFGLVSTRFVCLDSGSQATTVSVDMSIDEFIMNVESIIPVQPRQGTFQVRSIKVYRPFAIR